MDNWKAWLENLKAKPYSALGLLVLIALPVTLMLVFRSQDTRTSASAPDKLETEGGTFSSGAVPINDNLASNGKYVRFDVSQTVTPTPSTGSWGPRTAPTTPTGSNVYTVPSSIDGTGATDVSSAIQSFVNSVPNGTSSLPSIIVFPNGKTYKLSKGVDLNDRNYLTFWGYGNTFKTVGAGNVVLSSGFILHRSDNIKILGFTIDGTQQDLTSLSDGEYAMGVAMYDDSDNVEIADNYISDVYGDGIFVFVFEKPACDNWNFHHNLIERAGRQGITPNEGSGRIEYNIVRDIGMYSIDAEDQSSNYASNGGNKNLGPVIIANNWFDGWEWVNGWTPHALVSDYDIANFATINNITIENNLFTGGDKDTRSQHWDPQMGLISFWGTTPKTNMIIRNNTFNLPADQRSGWAIRLSNVNGGHIIGNVIPGQSIQCSSCSNVTITNNQ